MTKHGPLRFIVAQIRVRTHWQRERLAMYRGYLQALNRKALMDWLAEDESRRMQYPDVESCIEQFTKTQLTVTRAKKMGLL